MAKTNTGDEETKYSWTKKKVIELIEMWQSVPALWDISLKEYKNRNLKFDEMSKMATHFQTSVDEISKKIKSLKTQFSRERKKIEEQSRSGAGTTPEENVWFGYNMMKFLMEKNISLGSRNTLKDTEEASCIEDSISTSSIEPDEDDIGEHNIEHTASKFKKPLKTLEPIKPLKRKGNSDNKVDEAYKFMRSVQNNMTSKDHFDVYGENVASRMRLANKCPRDVAIAKNHIDNILFQLEMGQLSTSGVHNYCGQNPWVHTGSPALLIHSPPVSTNSSDSTNTPQCLSNPQSPQVQDSSQTNSQSTLFLTELNEYIVPKDL